MNIIDSFDLILIICFFIDAQAQIRYKSNGIYKGAVTWLPNSFIKKLRSVALKFCIALSSKWNRHRKERTLTVFEVGNYFSESYATDHVIVKMYDEILRFAQPSIMAPTEYADTLWNKPLRCNRRYVEYVFNRIFIEGLHGSIWQSVGACWSWVKNATVH